jgi:hypothetical protein
MSAQLNNTAQTTLNQVYQTANQSCVASCSNVQSGNTVFLDGSTTGNITFDQTCSASASCTINTTLDNLVTQLQQAQQSNANTSTLFGGLNMMSLASNVSNQSTTNQVQQIMNTVCQADVNNLQSDNMVYARNSTTGDIAFVQNGNAQADCIMTNLAIAKADQTQAATQSNTITSGGIGAMIVIAIIIVALVLISSRKKKDTDQTTPPTTTTAKTPSTAVGSKIGGGRLAGVR